MSDDSAAPGAAPNRCDERGHDCLNSKENCPGHGVHFNLRNRAKLENIFKAMRDLIAARGSPLPIYDILTSLEDSDGADQLDEESGD